MREELVRRAYSETTIRSYLHAAEAFRLYAGKRPEYLGPDDLRRSQVYLLEGRKLASVFELHPPTTLLESSRENSALLQFWT